jgi:hypothetical protein
MVQSVVRQLLLATASGVKKEVDRQQWGKHVETAMAGMATRTAAAAAAPSTTSTSIPTPSSTTTTTTTAIGDISENELLNYLTMSLAAGNVNIAH